MGRKEAMYYGHDHYLGTELGWGQLTSRAGHSSQRGSNGDSKAVGGPLFEQADFDPGLEILSHLNSGNNGS